MKKLEVLFSNNKNAKILDVGTGVGNFISIITQMTDDYSEIIGIDLLQRALDAAKKQHTDERINFFKMDALKMEFKDDSFDFVCLSNSLHHLEDVKATLTEMERVLKPGGSLLFCEMVNNNLDVRQISHLMLHHFAAEIDRDRGNFHDETMSDSEIIDLLKENSTLKIDDSWNLTYPKREENTKEELEWLLSTLDRIVESVKESDDFEYFSEKAETIRSYIKKHGFDSATSLIVVLK